MGSFKPLANSWQVRTPANSTFPKTERIPEGSGSTSQSKTEPILAAQTIHGCSISHLLQGGVFYETTSAPNTVTAQRKSQKASEMNNSENQSKASPNELYHQMTVRSFMPSLAPGMELGKLRKGSWSSNENPRWLHSAASSYLETWHAPSWGLWALPNVSNWKLTTATKKTASLREKITQISSTHARHAGPYFTAILCCNLLTQ